MSNLEKIFDNAIQRSFDNLCNIEKDHYQMGDRISKLLNSDKVLSSETLINLVDYNALACSKNIYALMRKVLYSRMIDKVQFRSILHSLLEFEASVKLLNDLEVDLWDNYMITDSGVIKEIKNFGIELNDIVISNLVPGSIHMTNLSTADFDTKLAEIAGVLRNQLHMIRIVAVNTAIKGAGCDEYHTISKQYLDWMVNISKLIKA